MPAVTLIAEVVVLIVLVGVVGLFSAAEASIFLLTRSRARRLIEADRRGARSVDAVLERPARLMGAAAVARALAYGTAAVSAAWASAELIESARAWPWMLVAAGVAVTAVFTLGETLPRTLAVHNPERVALAMAPPARRLAAVFSPVARLLGAGWLWIVGLVAEEPRGDVWVTEDTYRASALSDDEEVAREEAEEAFIDAVQDFTTKIVREVMVPRPDMECLEDTASAAEAVVAIQRSGYSRLPVFHESVDDILGVLYAKDLLVAMAHEGPEPAVASLVREAYFVPETKPVEELLVEMRSRTHIAIVADEYGGTAGLVTIEDLLEEIVGEIFDEYDRAEPMIVQLSAERYRIDGRMPIDDLNELFGTDIEIEADTVGGLFVELVGHIPNPGETVAVEGLQLTVDELEGNRVRRLVVEPAVSGTDEEDDDG